ncbi:fanconi-associated nuclease 1-like [Ischnura elegans]|uniref:fanconi-associated nuclease 1-like n=1 Tax=Ischnura elegans TaxID=197161 RepID=UPI001ED889E4|nr:fanconi-associated nuclease 1-like [Ischnura elegans]
MSKKGSKSIKDFFGPKGQNVSGSEASSSRPQPKSESNEAAERPSAALGRFGRPQTGVTRVRPKEEDSSSDSCDSPRNAENAQNEKDDDSSSQDTDESMESGHFYWRNFLEVLKDVLVNENIKGMFSSNELLILKDFNEMNSEEQKLYVRLLNRKHSWLKASSIRYDDINFILDRVIKTLIDRGFLSTDVSEEETFSLLTLMPVQEVRALCKCFRMKSDGKKEVLVKSLIDFGHRQKSIHRGISRGIKSLVRERAMKALGKMVKLSTNPRKLFLRIMLLHALPLGREMESDGRIPVLNEISRVKSNQITYPDYPLHPLKNIFRSRDRLIRYQEALELVAITNGKMLTKSYEDVVSLYYSAVNQLKRVLDDKSIRDEDSGLPLFLRSFTAGYALCRAVITAIDCLKIKKMYSEVVTAYQLLLSQELYVTHHRGKWYDQLALIHHRHLKDVSSALDVLMKGCSDESLSLVDKLLLANRGLILTNRKAKNRIEMEKGKALKSMLTTVMDPPEVSITATTMSSKIGMGSKMSYLSKSADGVGHVLSSVEETVIQYHRRLGFDKGVHAENAVSMSIFGVFLWDIIYTVDVEGVFICPYQSLPLDLKTGEFYKNRKEAIDKRLDEMKNVWTIDTMKDHVRNVAMLEQGKVSAVSWKTFEDLDQFELLMECIGLSVISKICRRMAEEYPIARRGFPDIIIWNSETKKCKFFEVKGPGDRLSPSQILWLNYLNESGADASVCHVKSIGAKSLKRQHDDSEDSKDDEEEKQ